MNTKQMLRWLYIGLPMLLAVTLLGLLVSFGRAQGMSATVQIMPASQEVAPQTSYTFTVMITDVQDLGGFEFDLAFDPTLLEVDDVTLGDFLGSTGRTTSPLGPTIDNNAGTLTYGAFSFGSQLGPNGTGVLAIVDFTSSATLGTSVLDLQEVQVLNTSTPPQAQSVQVEDGTVSINPLISRAIPFEAGWNFISLPLEPATPYSAESLCQEINSQEGSVTEIDRWHNAGWDDHICGLQFNNFSIELAASYFVRTNGASTWSIEGTAITSPIPLNLQIGWNAIGIPHTDAYTAETLCDEIISQGVTAIEIDRWHLGGWSGHICGYPFNDFPIERLQGYFVKASSSGTVTPSEPASAPLQQPSRRLTISPLDIPTGKAQPIRDLRLSNLTDSAVTLSWLTNGATTGYVLYGETPDTSSVGVSTSLGQVAVDVRGAAVEANTHLVTLTNLKPETSYYFKVVSGTEDESAPQTLTTAPSLENIPSSDTVYGQVFKADGVMPAAGSLVYLTLADRDQTGSSEQAVLLSALVDEEGYWHANLGNARVADGSDYFSYSPTDDAVTLVASGGTGVDFMATQTLSTGDMRPAEPLILLLPPDDKTHQIHLPIIIMR